MTTDSTNAPPPPERLGEIQALTARAQAGDHTAVPRLRELLAEYPEMAVHYGDMAGHAAANWIALTAGTDLHLRESLSARVAALRRELAGEAPDLVLALAADRVALSWLAANYHAAMEASALSARENPRLLAFRTKRRHLADRSHLTALAALVTLRKLLPPAANPAAAPDRAPALARHAGPGDVTNRLSEYFADLAFSPPAAARKDLAAVN